MLIELPVRVPLSANTVPSSVVAVPEMDDPSIAMLKIPSSLPVWLVNVPQNARALPLDFRAVNDPDDALGPVKFPEATAVPS
jgi:hypothetical protein